MSADHYGATEAARLLGLSARRVRQLATEGRLVAVGHSPLRLDARSVLEMREQRRAQLPAPVQESAAQSEQIAAILSSALATVESAAERVESVYRERLAIADRTEQALRDELAAERARSAQLAAQLAAAGSVSSTGKKKKGKRRKGRG